MSLFFLFFNLNSIVSAYPGSGQGAWQEAEIKLFEKLEEMDQLIEPGVMVNPLMEKPQTFEGESAVFGNSCLKCHGGEDGAQSTEQRYHGAITVDLIRTADEKSMVQEDGSLLIEVDPNGGVTNYKLVVGLSDTVYDGGHEDDRALAGWHFALPKGINMDLPYCMHIIGPNLSKVFPDNENAVFSDIKVAVGDDFEEKKGVLQIISGTQNATPNQNKVYGSLIVEYKYSEDVPVEEGLSLAELPGPTAPDAQLSSIIPTEDQNGNSTYVYYAAFAIILVAIVIMFWMRSRNSKQSE